VYVCQCRVLLGEPRDNNFADLVQMAIVLEPGERLILDRIVYPIYQGNIYAWSTSATLDTQLVVSECTLENL
jgi:hypothetical protein